MSNATTPNRMIPSAAAVCLFALGGCVSNSLVMDRARVYPEEKPQTATTDVQVARKVTKITMTNSSARSFGPTTVWVNGEYSLPIEGFAIGETLTLSLPEFVNEYGQRFQAGGFFATERPTRLVQAQIEEDAEMIGLIVVNEPR